MSSASRKRGGGPSPKCREPKCRKVGRRIVAGRLLCFDHADKART